GVTRENREGHRVRFASRRAVAGGACPTSRDIAPRRASTDESTPGTSRKDATQATLRTGAGSAAHAPAGDPLRDPPCARDADSRGRSPDAPRPDTIAGAMTPRLLDHPLAQDALTTLRRSETGGEAF